MTMTDLTNDPTAAFLENAQGITTEPNMEKAGIDLSSAFQQQAGTMPMAQMGQGMQAAMAPVINPAEAIQFDPAQAEIAGQSLQDMPAPPGGSGDSIFGAMCSEMENACAEVNEAINGPKPDPATMAPQFQPQPAAFGL